MLDASRVRRIPGPIRSRFMSRPVEPPEESSATAVSGARLGWPASRAQRRRAVTVVCVLLLAAGLLAAMLFGALGVHHAAPSDHAPAAWPIGMIPFLFLLLALAVFPLLPRLGRWWHSNLNRLLVSLLVAASTSLYLLMATDLGTLSHALHHALVDEYVPFMVLLFSLYVITGGIAIQGNLRATPATNTAILGLGTLLASLLGTTGASMLLIRPLLQTNRERTHRVHTVVFFIFLVSNIGGTLLPVGDPPLFLGFLHGVPFLWTLGLWKAWLLASIPLLATYFVWDTLLHRREPAMALLQDRLAVAPPRMDGGLNFLWLLLVLAAVASIDPSKSLPGTEWHPPRFLREGVLLAATGLSLLLTPRRARAANQFDYNAILEVAAIFVGIFVAMQVPLMVLRQHGAALGLSTPGQFFWTTGILSSFLDNAPTYEVFFETAAAVTTVGDPANLVLADGGVIDARLLKAVSVGAVFMGAVTYIGNGPNFMVKSVAESSGVRMPSFFGYMLYSVAVLGPVFVVLTAAFFW